VSVLQEPAVICRTAASTDPFEALVEALRNDFRRVFPSLRDREEEYFHVERGPDPASGTVWIEFTVVHRDGRTRRRLTAHIRENQLTHRTREERPIEEFRASANTNRPSIDTPTPDRTLSDSRRF
jgi:hypothetical protein